MGSWLLRERLAAGGGNASGVEERLHRALQQAREIDCNSRNYATEEITRLQKEVLDLQLRLKDIARL